jgi:FkbM family methyltransferase
MWKVFSPRISGFDVKYHYYKHYIVENREPKRMDGSNINGVKLLVPKVLEGILPKSPNPEYFDYEHYPYLGLKLIVSPGDTVFDLGASYGVMSCLISNLCGVDGKVFAFEANPTVIEMAKALAHSNNLTNINFINKVVGEKSGVTTDFFVVPGAQSVASTRNPEILKFHSDAISTKVDTIAVDDFVEETGVVPQVCKIDVEGSEYVVLKGMENLLSNHDVDLVIETHGDEMLKIGGDVDSLLQKLQKLGYYMVDLISRTPTFREEFAEEYNKKIGHVLLSKKLKNEELLRKNLTQATEEIANIPTLLNLTIDNIQNAIENNEFEKTKQLKDLLKRIPSHARMNYLYALSLHLQNKDLKKALHHYNLALDNGFDEYWVKYNRSSLLGDLGQVDAAMADVEALQKLKPGDQDAITIRERILSKNVRRQPK